MSLARWDALGVLWLNSWVGTFPWLDRVVQWLVSDYLVPVFLSLTLLGLWFGGRDRRTRERYQRAILGAVVAVGLANLVTMAINHLYFRPRPFLEYELRLLFYRPSDPSFPANPAVTAFALSTGILRVNKKIGGVLCLLAFLWPLSRIYAGVFYPSDVAAGIALGVLANYLGFKILNLLEPFPTRLLQLARILCLA